MLMRIIAQPLLNENSLFSQELSTNPHVENVDSVDNFEDNIIGNLNKPRFYKKIAVFAEICCRVMSSGLCTKKSTCQAHPECA